MVVGVKSSLMNTCATEMRNQEFVWAAAKFGVPVQGVTVDLDDQSELSDLAGAALVIAVLRPSCRDVCHCGCEAVGAAARRDGPKRPQRDCSHMRALDGQFRLTHWAVEQLDSSLDCCPSFLILGRGPHAVMEMVTEAVLGGWMRQTVEMPGGVANFTHCVWAHPAPATGASDELKKKWKYPEPGDDGYSCRSLLRVLCEKCATTVR